MQTVLAEAEERWGNYAIRVTVQFRTSVDFANSLGTSGLQPGLEFVRLESLRVFQSNLATFTEMMTGRHIPCDTPIDNAFLLLANNGAARDQHLQPILEEIRRLRDTVETQRQIITSLGYRRLIEHLPNKLHYDRSLSLKSHEQNSTRYWCEVWRGLVVQELNNMINNPPGTPTISP